VRGQCKEEDLTQDLTGEGCSAMFLCHYRYDGGVRRFDEATGAVSTPVDRPREEADWGVCLAGKWPVVCYPKGSSITYLSNWPKVVAPP